MFFAGLSVATEGQGLAVGAIVFFYGIASAFIAFIVLLFAVIQGKS